MCYKILKKVNRLTNFKVKIVGEKMEKNDFKEKINHGTDTFPVAVYSWNGEFVYTVNQHWHKEVEILFFEKGEFDLIKEDEVKKVVAPAFVFINSKVMHGVTLLKEQRETALVFDPRILSYEWFDDAQRTIIEPIINGKLFFPEIIAGNEEAFGEVKSIYQKIIKAYGKDDASSKLKVKLYLTELLTYMYENNFLERDVEEATKDNGQVETMQRAINYIREHMDKRLTVGDIAAVVGMSEQYFCRYFKRFMGKTITEYINEIRVDRAAELLNTTDEKIIEIGLECGYDNISYFIKRFKNVKGVTPKEYRRSIKQ